MSWVLFFEVKNMNIWDILIIVSVLALILVAFKVAKGRKKKGGCGCCCAGCTRNCEMRKN